MKIRRLKGKHTLIYMNFMNFMNLVRADDKTFDQPVIQDCPWPTEKLLQLNEARLSHHRFREQP